MSGNPFGAIAGGVIGGVAGAADTYSGTAGQDNSWVNTLGNVGGVFANKNILNFNTKSGII